MTAAIATEVQQRRRATAAPTTIVERLLVEGSRRYDELRRPSWPSPRYREDPVSFARDALGVVPWSRQVEILEAVRDNDRVAIASGHKVGKSHTAAIIALWFFCSFPNARVVMSSTTSRQVDTILWRELRMQFGRSRVVLNDAPPRELAKSGLKAPDFREIVGFTAREAEAVAGVSGKDLLYIIDEASGVPEVIFDAIEGNRAGGARLVMFSNPTRIEGAFFDAFHEKSRFYKTLAISSEESPNVTGEWKQLWPAPMGGLATKAWIEEKRDEWGADSALYRIRVKGEFVLNEEGRIIPVTLIAAAQVRWADTPDDEGPLHIGVDPAGEGGQGDESAFAVRRGPKLLALYGRRGLTPDAHVAEVLGLLREWGRPGDSPRPVVAVDAEGTAGIPVRNALHAVAGPRFRLLSVKSGGKFKMAPNRTHETRRDAMWAGVERWLREGGAIPEDVKLAKELAALEWRTIAGNILKATSKDDLRKKLGRSPDRADALALSIWNPRSFRDDDLDSGDEHPATPQVDGARPYDAGAVFDPYGGAG